MNSTEHPQTGVESTQPPNFSNGWQQQTYTLVCQSARQCVKHEYFPIIAVIVVSTLLNFLMVFEWSYYKSYLTSDMHGYWERAVQIFSGDEKTPNTWVSNAPFYSRVIATLFTWLEYFHLRHTALEVILSLNVLLSGFATLSLYLIGLRVLHSKKWALALACVYAFAYPNLYFNVFLLGEPFAIPIIISAVCLVMYLQNSYKVYLAGLVLAFGVGIRPSNGLLGLPCALYIFLYGFSFKQTPIKDWIKVLFPRAVKAGLFSIAFFAVIFTILAENNRVSDGKLRGITAHSGYNFFLGQTQVHKIISSWDGLTYGFVPSSVAGNPEYGTITTNIPIYDSKTYYQEGWKILKDNPHLWWDHFKKYEHLFFNNLFPAVPSVKGFTWFFDPFRYITFYALLFCGLLFITIREKDTPRANVALFGSIFGLCAAALFFYTVTHQYFTNFSYALYILAFLYIRSCVLHFNKYKIFILGYITVVILGTLGYYAHKEFRYLLIDPKVKVLVENNASPIYKLEHKRRITSSKEIDVNNLEFIGSLTLKHRTTGEYPEFKENFFMNAKTDFEVLEDGFYMFTIYADDGYRMKIDGATVMESDKLKKMDEFKIRHFMAIEKGKHTLEIELFQSGILSGLVGYYRRVSPTEPPESPYEYFTRYGQGNFIGDDSKYTKFSYPNKRK